MSDIVVKAAGKLQNTSKTRRQRIAGRLLGMAPAWVSTKLIDAWPIGSKQRRQFLAATMHIDQRYARIAYRDFNQDLPGLEENYAPDLIDRAVAFDYVSWPRRIREHITGRSVLDVGCGTGLHGIGYIVAGAGSYTGLDPKISLDNDVAKNLNSGKHEHFGATPREIMRRMPRIRLIPGTFEDIAPQDKFEVVVLHNVTEHLINIEKVFEGIVGVLADNGIVIYNHHNFYSWNGHHLAPKSVDKIDEVDPEQQQLMDWNHLDFEPPEGHYFHRGLNRIRLDDLRALTERFFDIDTWEERPSKTHQGAGRLTPEIKARHPEYTERELTTQNVFCIARHKAEQDKEPKKPSSSKKKPSSRERDMRRDEVFMDFFERCEPNTMTTMERLYSLYSAVDYIVRREVPGDIVECGVWRGGSMMMAALTLLHAGGAADRQLWLYDTFAGMPEPGDADRKFGGEPARDKWVEHRQGEGSDWNYASKEDVRAALLSTGFPEERIHFVEGKVEDTIPETTPDSIALLRLDTDFYASTRHELTHLYPILRSGGPLIIDDYGSWEGSRKAVDDYFHAEKIAMFLARLDAGGRIGIKE
ncbi:MAG: TylF/MycF/NovP-related O-methyltransferase [Azospirillaceae bacterium]